MATPQAEIIPENVDLHSFDDVSHWRQDIFDKSINGLKQAFPREYGTVRLELSDLNYKPKVFTPEDEKKARMERSNLQVPIKGTVTLRDKDSGEVLDQVKNKTVLSVPYLTDRGTFVNKGSNYTSMRQARLLPGAYSRRRNNGQLEVHYNVKPGSGRTFRVTMDPETAVFRMEIGGSNLKLYSILKSLGVSDKELRDRWGDNVYSANAASYDTRDVNKLYKKLYPFDESGDANIDRAEKIREALESNIVLGSTLESTLGTNFRKRANIKDRIRKRLKLASSERRMALEDDDEQYLSLDDILGSSEKLIAINRGEAEPDNRDALQYKKIYTTGDLIAERIKIDADKTARSLVRKLAKRRSLEYLPGNFLNKYTEGQIVSNTLSTPGEETNPILLYDQLYRITQMGDGGIGSSSAINENMQNVNPSLFSFIDPISGPECFHENMSVMTDKGWKLWPDVTDDDKLLTVLNDSLVYEKPSRIVREAYEGPMFGFKNKFVEQSVTPNHRVQLTRDGYIEPVIKKAADLHNEDQFGLIAGIDLVLTQKDPIGHFHIPAESSETCKTVPIKQWLEFLGFFLSVGHIHEKDQNCIVLAPRNNTDNKEACEKIEECLEGCGFQWDFTASGDYLIQNKALALCCKECNLCNENHIPEYVFKAHETARRSFINCIMLGQGTANDSDYAYATASKSLAEDLQKLCIELGFATCLTKEKDERKSTYSGVYVVSILNQNIRIVLPHHRFTENYVGMVYCATVKSGLLFVKGPSGIGFWSGNSERAGVDVRATYNSRLGSDGRIYQKFFNPRLNRYEWLSARDLQGKSLAFKD